MCRKLCHQIKKVKISLKVKVKMIMMIAKVMMKELNLMMTKALISIRLMMMKKHKKMSLYIHMIIMYNETHDVDDEEYDRINEEIYDDVNVELKDAELVDEGKGDEEMTDAKKVNAELEEANQQVASAQVHDEAQATTTAAPATQKEKADVPRHISSRICFTSSNCIPESETLFAIHLRVSDLEKEV
ncbi:hypothetical protein Tco_0313819 [Tanacetum coccineum]